MSQPLQRLAHLMPSTAIYAGDMPVPIYPTIPAPSSERPKDINDLHRATTGGLSLAMLEDLSESLPLAEQSRPMDPPSRARSQVLEELRGIWLGRCYDIFRVNCCHFCIECHKFGAMPARAFIILSFLEDIYFQ